MLLKKIRWCETHFVSSTSAQSLDIYWELWSLMRLMAYTTIVKRHVIRLNNDLQCLYGTQFPNYHFHRRYTLLQCNIQRYQGAVSIRKTVLLGMVIPMLKIRRPTGRLIFNMGIPIPGKTVFYIETGPWYQPKLHSATIPYIMVHSVEEWRNFVMLFDEIFAYFHN